MKKKILTVLFAAVVAVSSILGGCGASQETGGRAEGTEQTRESGERRETGNAAESLEADEPTDYLELVDIPEGGFTPLEEVVEIQAGSQGAEAGYINLALFTMGSTVYQGEDTDSIIIISINMDTGDTRLVSVCGIPISILVRIPMGNVMKLMQGAERHRQSVC